VITRLRVSNFKVYRSQTVNLAPLTLIVGTNNSGKSSLFEAIQGMSEVYAGTRNTGVPAFMEKEQSRIGIGVDRASASADLVISYGDDSGRFELRAHNRSDPARSVGLSGVFKGSQGLRDRPVTVDPLPDWYRAPRYVWLLALMDLAKEIADADSALGLHSPLWLPCFEELEIIRSGAPSYGFESEWEFFPGEYFPPESLFKSWVRQDIEYFTEGFGSDWGTPFEETIAQGIRALLKTLRKSGAEDECSDIGAILEKITENPKRMIEVGELRTLFETIPSPFWEPRLVTWDWVESEVTKTLLAPTDADRTEVFRLEWFKALSQVNWLELAPYEKRFYNALEERPPPGALKSLAKELAYFGIEAPEVFLDDEDERGNQALMVRSRNRPAHNVADLGRGLRRLIPLLLETKGTGGAANRINMIEEPEAHLHQKAQAELGDFLIRRLRENKSNNAFHRSQWLVETHSPHLIFRILRRIRETHSDTLPKGAPVVLGTEVAILCVERNSTGGSLVRELSIGPNGELLDPLPPDFFDEGISDRAKGWEIG